MRHQSGNDRLRPLSMALAIGLCLLLGACEQESPPGTGASGTATFVPLSETTLQPADDRSLLNDEYILLGLPSYDREWSSHDMMMAADRLQELAASNPAQLPRLDSARSGKMFARIVAPENLVVYRNRSFSIATRIPLTLQYLEALSTINKIYINALMSDKTFGNDLISLLGTALRLSSIMLELVDEYMLTISKDDPTYQTRLEGLDQMRRGLANVVVGNIVTLTETQNFSLSARLRLIEYSRETFPNIVPKLSSASRSEVLHKLTTMADDPKLRDLREQLILLRDEVRAVTQADGQQ